MTASWSRRHRITGFSDSASFGRARIHWPPAAPILRPDNGFDPVELPIGPAEGSGIDVIDAPGGGERAIRIGAHRGPGRTA